jgi:hypothetical protein
MTYQRRGSLDSRIGQLTYLLAIKIVPFSSFKLCVKSSDKLGVNEVDEGVTNVAGILTIQRQVNEVNFVFIFSHFVLQHFLCVFVGYMPDHNSSSAVHVNLN